MRVFQSNRFLTLHCLRCVHDHKMMQTALWWGGELWMWCGSDQLWGLQVQGQPGDIKGCVLPSWRNETSGEKQAAIPSGENSTKGILFWYAVGKKMQLCSGYVGLLSRTAGFPVILELLKYSVAVTKCDFCSLSFCVFHLAGCGLFIKLQAAPCTASGCTTTFSANRIPCASQLLPSLMQVQNVSWLSENRSQLASPHGWAKLPLTPSGVVLPSFSVSGAHIRRQGCEGSSTAQGNETAGNLPCSAAGKDSSCDSWGCGWGLKGWEPGGEWWAGEWKQQLALIFIQDDTCQVLRIRQ